MGCSPRGKELIRKMWVVQEVVYFLEAEMWVTKQLGSGGRQEANKMADEEARSFSHRPATDFNLRQHRFPFTVALPTKHQKTRWLGMQTTNEYSFNPGKSDGPYSPRTGS